MRHNDDLNPFIRSYDVKSLQSVLHSVVEGKTEEAYVIVRNSRNYSMYFFYSRFPYLQIILQYERSFPASNWEVGNSCLLPKIP